MVNNIDNEIQSLINQIVERINQTSGNSDYLTIGLAIWDIFSNNNTAINSAGVELDLGSWREAAGSIANSINSKSTEELDSSDFFQGTASSDLNPADQLDNYTEIFLLLHELGWDWLSGTKIEYAVCVMDPYTVQAYKAIYKK